MRTHPTMRQSVDITTLIYVCVVLCNMNVEHCTTAELTCPDISYLQDSALMNCSMLVPYATLQYSGPGNLNAPQCVAENKYCTPVKGYNASVVNATYSRLRILSIHPYHGGRWTCKNIPDGPSASCNLVTSKTPNCSITSKEDTDVLAQYQALTLTVDIQDYYCSTALTFSLQTGKVTTLLMKVDSLASVTHNTSSVTLNVTDSHLGAVGLTFSCHNSQWNLTCDGVTELRTPTCSISSDKDTDKLVLYEELTLSVDIIGYNCSVASNFTLQTGNVQQLLDVSGAGAGIDHATQTFNVTKTHLGGVRLIFNCQHRHWNLTCDGIAKLLERTKTAAVPGNNGLAPASTPIIIVCVVVAIVFLVIVVIIIVFLVKRKQVTRIKAQASLKPSSPPYITVGAPGSSAYATVELNDAPSGSKNITVIDAAGYACTEDFVNNAENRSCSLTKDESHELSLAATSTDNSKNDLGVVVQHIIPENDTTHINELYASIKKTKDMTVHNDDTAI